ncbi:MAG: FecCD family ABC transporter permease [Desulfobacteria bacterium]
MTKNPPNMHAYSAYEKKRKKRITAIILLFALLLVLIPFMTTIGSVSIPFNTVWRILIAKILFLKETAPIDIASNITTIVIDIRLPRIILAGLVGGGLAVAGATYQGIFRNPLADPCLLGVSQGAALGAVASFFVPAFLLAGGTTPVLAFAGAIIAVAVVYFLARVDSALPVTTLILAGVALGAFLAAATSYLILVSGEHLHGIILWLMGGFWMTEWDEVRTVFPLVACGITVIILFSRTLNVMQLDEEQATQLGINVERAKITLLVAASLITAAAVCFCGVIGFVGIIIPHMVRLVWGPDYRFLVPLSALTGAIFLVVADAAARSAFSQEIPIGILTAFTGAPFFLYILRRKRKTLC